LAILIVDFWPVSKTSSLATWTKH